MKIEIRLPISFLTGFECGVPKPNQTEVIPDFLTLKFSDEQEYIAYCNRLIDLDSAYKSNPFFKTSADLNDRVTFIKALFDKMASERNDMGEVE